MGAGDRAPSGQPHALTQPLGILCRVEGSPQPDAVEWRRRELAEVVEAARVAAEKDASKERERLATALKEAHGTELARVHWRIDAHDKHFVELNGSVEKLAGAVEQQAEATRGLGQEMRESFAKQESAALRRELAAKDTAEEAEQKAVEAAKVTAAESRKLLLQSAGAVVAALLTALGAIAVKLL